MDVFLIPRMVNEAREDARTRIDDAGHGDVVLIAGSATRRQETGGVAIATINAVENSTVTTGVIV